MKNLKKLNAKGFGHIELAIVILVIAAIGGVGSYLLTRSFADGKYAYSSDCGVSGGFTHFKKDIKMNGKPSIGYVRVYTQQSGGNTDWCAFTQRDGAANGVKGFTLIAMWQDSDVGPIKYKQNKGDFSLYAGPVTLNNQKCIVVQGEVKYKGDLYQINETKLCN